MKLVLRPWFRGKRRLHPTVRNGPQVLAALLPSNECHFQRLITLDIPTIARHYAIVICLRHTPWVFTQNITLRYLNLPRAEAEYANVANRTILYHVRAPGVVASGRTEMNDSKLHKPAKIFLLLGSTTALIGVILGAFGAHGLRVWIPPDRLMVYQTAVQYQLYHALGLFGVGLLLHQFPTHTLIQVAGWFMFAGITIFSGSLYALSITSAHWLGAITPIGGVTFIISWVLLIISIIRRR